MSIIYILVGAGHCGLFWCSLWVCRLLGHTSPPVHIKVCECVCVCACVRACVMEEGVSNNIP